jgi:hypothetical protein
MLWTLLHEDPRKTYKSFAAVFCNDRHPFRF